MNEKSWKYNNQWNWYLKGPRFTPKMPKTWPKNLNFQKMKKTHPGIPPSYKYAKFQTDLTIYAFSWVPQRFLVHLGSRTGSPVPKNQHFEKNKKTPPGIPKLYVCQMSDRFDHLCLPLSAPKVFGPFRVQDWLPWA